MTHEIARWWKERTGPGKLALASVALLFASQFFTYYQSRNWGTLSIRADFSTVGHYYFDPVKGGTGWEIHPWATIVLITLAAMHGSSLPESRLFRRFGYWLTVPIAFFAVSPGSISHPGGKMGIASLALFLIAAIWNLRSKDRANPNEMPPMPPLPKV